MHLLLNFGTETRLTDCAWIGMKISGFGPFGYEQDKTNIKEDED